MPVSVFRNAQKNTKKEWIKMVQKTIAELKKLNPIDLSSDVIVEKVRFNSEIFYDFSRLCDSL